MTRKQKYLVLIPFLIMVVGAGIWLARSAIENMIVVRSDNQTKVQEAEASPGAESPSEDAVAKSLAHSPNSELSKSVLQKLDLTGDEPEFVYYALDTTPDDTIYPQWYTTIIDAPAAWDVTTGSAETVVAVIDTGYALAHEDLSTAWFINVGEQGQTQSGDDCWNGSAEDKQTNGCDDDTNGFVDDWRGWDFSNEDNTPQAGQDSDGATHGTKVAGLAGGRGNNATGTASVNWDTTILPLQGMYDEGFGYSSDIASAIVYAVDSGADVINLSLGSPSPDSIMLSAIRYADANNVIVVTSAGNCGDEQSSPACIGYPSPGGMGYPARYPETIAVGATTSSDTRAGFSSWGAELDIVAPGSGTIRTPSWSASNQSSLYSDTSYGTSFSSPIVAGYIAVIRGLEPDLSRSEVLSIIADGSDKVAGMGSAARTDEYGYGRINMNMGIAAIDKYKTAVTKTGGNSVASVEKPLISTNIGHASASAVTSTRQAVTYCISAPDTSCRLTLTRQSSGTVINLGSKQTNTQGIAVWYWRKGEVGSSGTYIARVTASAVASDTEMLIVQ